MKLSQLTAILAVFLPLSVSAACYDNTRVCHIETAKQYLAVSRGELKIYINLGYPGLLARHMKEKGLLPEEVGTTLAEVKQLERKAVRVGLEQDLRTCREGGLPVNSTHRMQDIKRHGFTFEELKTTESEVLACDAKVRRIHEEIDQFLEDLKKKPEGKK